MRYGGLSLDVFLSSQFTALGVGGTDNLGGPTNAEVVFASLALGIGGAYAVSYAFYVAAREGAEGEVNEKRVKAAAMTAAKAAAAKNEKMAKKAEQNRTEQLRKLGNVLFLPRPF